MAGLKEKISQAMQKDSQLEVVLDDLQNLQENLLTNHLNPVFKQTEKNKILKKYVNLQNLVKLLKRYLTLKQNGYQLDAQKEKEEIENIMLKTGIDNWHYVWHCENNEHTCDKCKELDGKVFDFRDEVPERLHPNCRCTVKVVEDTYNKIKTDNNTHQNSQPQTEQQPQQQTIPNTSQQQPQNKEWILPVAKGHKITSPYGYRMHPVHHKMKLHDGIDINATANTPVYAVADGKVSMAQWYNGYGNYVEIDHGNGIHSFYGHLTSYNLKKGDIVHQGQNIGKSGNTGIGTGAHLHFGIHKNNIPDDPTKYLPSF